MGDDDFDIVHSFSVSLFGSVGVRLVDLSNGENQIPYNVCFARWLCMSTALLVFMCRFL